MGLKTLIVPYFPRSDVCPGSIVRLLWHEDLNQLMIGSSDANIYCCYDPYTSVKGIKFSKEKIKKKHDDVFDFDAPKYGHAPCMGRKGVHR